MKKEDFTGLVVYLLMIAVAVIFGFTVLKEYAGGSGLGNLFILFILGAIVSGILVSALLVEFGHIVGALIGGYAIESVNILGFTFYKKNGKFKFKFSEFDGLTGETKLAFKKETKKEPNPAPHLLFPTLFLVVLLTLSIVLFVVFNRLSNGQKDADITRAAYFILVIGVLGSMVLIYNVFPAQVDTQNDGYRLTLVSNKTNKEAFNELLRVQRAIENGEENVELKTFDDITDFTANLNLTKIYKLLEEEKYEEAEPLINHILEAKEKISFNMYLQTKGLLIYSVVMSKSLEEFENYCNTDISLQERKSFLQHISMSTLRAYILISGLVDKSENEVLLAVNKIVRAYKKADKARQPIELKLYNKALNTVIENHPKWDLKGYLLEEK